MNSDSHHDILATAKKGKGRGLLDTRCRNNKNKKQASRTGVETLRNDDETHTAVKVESSE